MNKLFSHLIWLGAGQAKEPSGLINQAKQVTLVDARESACEYLKKQFPSEHVQVASKLITVHGGQQSFTEYNLPEYSALQAETGLKRLFPGLKIVHQEAMASVSLEQFFNELNLTDNKNLLVVDLPDIDQAFLEALHKTDELHKFSKVYIFANPEPLYLDALNASAIVNFLRLAGYVLQETINTDPDFPCLVFGANPLWLELQQTNQLNAKLVSDTKDLQTQQETLKQQLAESKQQADAIKKESESLKQQLAEAKQQTDLIFKERETLKQQADATTKERELFKQQLASQQQQKKEQDNEQEKLKQKLAEAQKKLTDANGLLDQATKQSAARKDMVSKLEKEKRELEEINKNLKLKQNLLEKELIKAEAQIELIKMLLIKA